MNTINRLNIGRRLSLCFAVLILLMLGSDALLLWEFHKARAQAERLSGISQELVAVVRLQRALLSFDERLDKLAKSEDVDRLSREAGPLRAALLEESERTRRALAQLPAGVRLDPTFLPTLEAIESTLPSQLEAITNLAAAKDWAAVRLRLANEKKPLEAQTSSLVRRVEQQVSEEQADAALQVGRVQRRISQIIPVTAAFTFLIAALVGVAITRSITDPLRQLMAGSRALARGEFQYQVPVIGQDELAQLGQAFNLTAGTLQSLHDALRKREAYLAEAQRLSHAGSWAFNVGTGLIFWSAETYNIFGIDPKTSPTREIFLQRIHPDDHAALHEMEAKLMKGRDAECTYRMMFPDGSVKFARTVAHAVTNDSGHVIEFVGTVMDVTERKRAEEERERLRQAQADLARINRVNTMGELTASLAHEIRQPISAAMTNAQTCLRWLGREQPEIAEAREAALRVVKDVTRASDIMSRVRSLFRKGAPQRELLDVNELIQEMIALLRNEASRYSIAIRGKFSANVHKVMADRVQLQQVFMNLILNGIDAIKELGTGGELTIKSEVDDSRQLLISVSDTGVGLRPGQADQIFDAFFTTKPQGTGMGLPICRSIIESHGGRLWTTADSGQGGATFHFTLPTNVEAEAR